MKGKTIDPIKPWFFAAKELGEFIGIRFGHLSFRSEHPEWHYLPHTDYDGIGGLAHLLRERGATLNSLPQIKHPTKSSWFCMLRLLAKFLESRTQPKWAKLSQGLPTNSASFPPPAVSYYVFSETVTTQIRKICRKTNITVNSFLLKHLNKATRPSLEDHSSIVPWMVPVNLRGKVTRSLDTENHSSYVGIRIKSFETASDIHRKIYRALGNGEHWANWHAYKLGAILPQSLCRYLIAKNLCMSQLSVGSFSNLGDWDPKKEISSESCQGSWLFAPPVLRCQHLGVGCVTFQNKLSLTIQVHPDLTTDPEVPKAWIHAWIKEIELDLVSVLAESVIVPIVAA